jgi:hypothetical protein
MQHNDRNRNDYTTQCDNSDCDAAPGMATMIITPRSPTTACVRHHSTRTTSCIMRGATPCAVYHYARNIMHHVRCDSTCGASPCTRHHVWCDSARVLKTGGHVDLKKQDQDQGSPFGHFGGAVARFSVGLGKLLVLHYMSFLLHTARMRNTYHTLCFSSYPDANVTRNPVTQNALGNTGT